MNKLLTLAFMAIFTLSTTVGIASAAFGNSYVTSGSHGGDCGGCGGSSFDTSVPSN